MQITLDDITIPSPVAYSSDEPFKNAENFFYVLLQILTKMKAIGAVFDDKQSFLYDAEGISYLEDLVGQTGAEWD